MWLFFLVFFSFFLGFLLISPREYVVTTNVCVVSVCVQTPAASSLLCSGAFTCVKIKI